MTRFDSPDFTYRRHGPAATAAGDGLEGSYKATVHEAPSDGQCKVIITDLDRIRYRTAFCSASLSASPGDLVLVTFDHDKDPWIVVH